jgi:hypothetical protein
MKIHRFGFASPLVITLTLVLLFCGGAQLHAQRFMHLFGDSCLEDGASCHKVTTGGYVAVGRTHSPYAGSGHDCAHGVADIFVVRMTDKGTVMWSRTYDLGGRDVPSDIIECSNGDFAITGFTNLNSGSCISAGANQDAFILRITGAGNVSWCRFYGTDAQNEVGAAIIQARYAQSAAVAVGDLVVAGGRWKPDSPATRRDGWIFRVNGGTGALRWSRLYGDTLADEFYDLCESVSYGAATDTNRGDIIAAGYSNSYNASNTSNGFIVRVSGAVGTFLGGAPRNAAVYGGSTDTVVLHSVAEQAIGLNAGNLVYAGDFWQPTTAAAGGGFDIYLLKTAANPCSRIADRWIGDNGLAEDHGLCIREVNLPAGSGLTNGSLYVGGLTRERTGYGADGYIMQVNTGTLALVGAFHVYGSPADEWYNRIDPVAGVVGFRTGGLLACGPANQGPGGLPTAGDPGQMWVTKTDNGLVVNCCDTIWTVASDVPALVNSCHAFVPPTIASDCSAQWDTTHMEKIDTLCNDSLGVSRDCPYPAAPRIGSRTDAGGSLSGDASAVKEGIVSSYPNPVESGGVLSLTYALSRRDVLAIEVADLRGRIVYGAHESFAPGICLLPIPTGGWPAGTYIIKVTSGGHSSSTPVVVVR